MNRAPALALCCAFLLTQAISQEKAHLELDSPFASYVEADFPFFTQTVDARAFGESPQVENLTPRGIVVPVGNGCYGCFDPDLLRWALFWRESEEGEYLSMNGMGSGSYRLPNRKAAPGQSQLPHPYGTPLLAMPLRPGGSPDKPILEEIRDRGAAEPEELGLGPVPPEIGRFLGIRLIEGGMQLEYRIGACTVQERLLAEGEGLTRLLQVGPRQKALLLRTGPGDEDWLSLAPAESATVHRILISPEGKVSVQQGGPFPAAQPPSRRWKERVKTGAATPPAKPAAWVYDDLSIPVPNPWKRNVRLSDLAFYPDGRAALVTYDGDIWLAEDLAGAEGTEWTRFASGLHEPQSLAIRDGEIYVFDRNGVVCLHDTDGNGEADWYETVTNAVAQSAETRQFPMDFVALPDGGFYLAYGGQIGSSVGKYNGTVVRVAANGQDFEVIATGLRQPYLGYDPDTGLLTASDQQGNWKPATPIYRIERGRYFGFQPEKFKDQVVHPAPIDAPEVWIPHFINQSGAGQVWIRRQGEGPLQMGAINDTLVHIGYNRPEIFKIYLDPESRQGAVMPLLSGFPAGLLNGRVNPRDGYLYLTGFTLWGTSGTRLSGIFRVRPGEVDPWLPREIRAEARGVLLRFDAPLSRELASDLGRYSADRWNYKQTHEYGSGNYRLDGEAGQDPLPVLSAKLSEDGQSLFLGIADMRPSHSLRLTYRLPVPEVTQVENAYLTIHSLPSEDLRKYGFADNEVDLTPRADLSGGPGAVKPTAEIGKEVALRFGCIACHATGDPSMPTPPAPGNGSEVAVGPPWIGLWGSKRVFTDGSTLSKVDAAYIRESILDPARRVMEGYEMERTGVGMPSYLGVLRDHEIESLILYIETLKAPPAAKGGKKP